MAAAVDCPSLRGSVVLEVDPLNGRERERQREREGETESEAEKRARDKERDRRDGEREREGEGPPQVIMLGNFGIEFFPCPCQSQ